MKDYIVPIIVFLVSVPIISSIIVGLKTHIENERERVKEISRAIEKACENGMIALPLDASYVPMRVENRIVEISVCKHCGAIIKNDAFICEYCGRRRRRE